MNLPQPSSRRDLALDDYVAGLRRGDRTVLARAITLVESTNPAHRRLAGEVLEAALPLTGKALRVGITGVPGVGKSTFIEALGTLLTGRGHRLAVLAVDPSSTRSGGSILGDKTRMPNLATNPAAFVRPSPSAGTLGGVARATRETMLLCEAAGYDIVLVETVGVGQSETVVDGMVDFFLALMLPGAGDELQGIKKGLVEIADMIAVNKADGENRLRAGQAATHYRSALRILQPRVSDWPPPVVTVSAITGEGLAALWSQVEEHARLMTACGEHAARRRRQQVAWLWALIEGRLLDRFRADGRVAALLTGLEKAVATGAISPGAAAETLLDAATGDQKPVEPPIPTRLPRKPKP